MRRAGLGHYASGFEHHGHFITSSLVAASVDVKTVERWYPDLKANEEESRRMKLILSGSESITKQLRLVDADCTRDLFLLHAQQLRRSTKAHSLRVNQASPSEAQAKLSTGVAMFAAPMGLARTRSAEAQAAEAGARHLQSLLDEFYVQL